MRKAMLLTTMLKSPLQTSLKTCRSVSNKIGAGNVINLTIGHKLLATLQATFTAFKWVIGFICRKPNIIPSAEPLVERAQVTTRIVAAKVTNSTPWSVSTPQTITGMTTEAYMPKLTTRPEWVIV